MILWFLRLFPLFRSAEALESELASVREALESEVQDHIRTRDRLESALDDRAKLWEQMERALSSERSAYQMQINHHVQRTGGGVPYPEVHSLPEESVPKQQSPGPAGRAGRWLPSQRAAMAQKESLEIISRELYGSST